jgi:hypothetical protein
MWNSLNNNIRNVDTLSKFKSELKKIDETENHSVPKHFFCGPRKLAAPHRQDGSDTIPT